MLSKLSVLLSNVKWYIPLDIESAKFITVLSRVFCKTKYSKLPEILTIPVIFISPIGGRSLFKASPGSKGPFFINILPMLVYDPKQESIAIIYGFKK